MAVKIISASTPKPKRVTITIAGATGSGKSIIAAAVADFLDKAGIDVALEDSDIAEFRTFALKARMIDDLSNVEVKVETQTTANTPFNSTNVHTR